MAGFFDGIWRSCRADDKGAAGRFDNIIGDQRPFARTSGEAVGSCRSRHAPLKGRSSGRTVECDGERMNRRPQDALLDGWILVLDLLRLR
jgi:hypothetical protein